MQEACCAQTGSHWRSGHRRKQHLRIDIFSTVDHQQIHLSCTYYLPFVHRYCVLVVDTAQVAAQVAAHAAAHAALPALAAFAAFAAVLVMELALQEEKQALSQHKM